MKKLKAVLASVYIVLILLLLLFMLRKCHNEHEPEPQEVDTIVVSPPVQDSTVVQPPVDTTEVDTTAVREAEQTGQSGNLKVTLRWDFAADIDLHVMQPNGKEIYYKYHKDNSTGGKLDVDNRSGGTGAAENIFWANPPQGQYLVSLVYFKANKSRTIPQTGTCTVIVLQEGKEPKTYKVEMSIPKEKKAVTTVVVE
ncbi:MAG: hypothetical protein IKH26_02475 [Bacteroidaceae bacterium]|nr:hypothetical protein [Bacteroidaceae bacterium]